MISARWYESVLGFEIRGERFNEAAGLPWVHLIHPSSRVSVGLVEHPDNSGERFDERRSGLDHLSFAVARREDLEAFARRLSELGFQARILDTEVASVIVLRDPDNIQIELCAWRKPVE
jgi:catechol 2,3-dioxygenase-like lactoylglutathione lyase family enzyme